jgi:hypothetical protein
VKFTLTAEEEAELGQLVEHLEQWVHELESFDLEGYDPLLVPAGEGGEVDGAAADD